MPRLKKWFMLQMWRIQQVAQVLTLALLALNLSLQAFGLIKWRTGSLLSTSYIGVPMILLLLVAVIWTFAIFWDLRLRMWRDQANVAVERNPYAKERLSSKEVAWYVLYWVPMLEALGKNDRAVRESVESLRNWCRAELESDPILRKDTNDLVMLMMKKPMDALDILNKKNV